TQALMTWNVTCTYSQFLARKNPACCVSLSSFYNKTITPCPSCTCDCQNKRNCVKSDSKILSMVGVHTPKKDNEPLMQCTHHMCPIRVHWHVKQNYKDYWRVKIAITNFNYRMNYSLWTFAIQHPNLNNVTQVFSFDYKPILPYASINDTGMFFGMKRAIINHGFEFEGNFLYISWITHDTRVPSVNIVERNDTIHDFYGIPKPLYQAWKKELMTSWFHLLPEM
ncbi:hypothetical protein S245_063829, partial [Arachis hypogaea]